MKNEKDPSLFWRKGRGNSKNKNLESRRRPAWVESGEHSTGWFEIRSR